LAELVNVFGHQAVVLSSGSDALDRIRQQRFDAVFTDLRMPGMNGLSLRQAIKDIDTGLARKTVIVTGDTVMGPRNEGQPADGEGFVLEKPFAAEEVRALLEKLRVL
jgi:CheY-like chemotaxis protein